MFVLFFFLPVIRARQLPQTPPNSRSVEPGESPRGRRSSVHTARTHPPPGPAAAAAAAGGAARSVRTANQFGGKRRRGPGGGEPREAHHRAATYQAVDGPLLVTSPSLTS